LAIDGIAEVVVTADRSYEYDDLVLATGGLQVMLVETAPRILNRVAAEPTATYFRTNSIDIRNLGDYIEFGNCKVFKN
jgi:glycine/D-amino acid oxidase-like deaminating enzyme